jgi:GT2 family glycosyltransferase
MNLALTLTRNNISLSKNAVWSVAAQDIPTHVYAIDNGSTDGTVEWLTKIGSLLESFPDNHGVSAGWNLGLSTLFASPNCEHVLVINNDVILPQWFYGELLRYQEPFVTGVTVDSMEAIHTLPQREPLQRAPDFSGFLIRREAWEKIGPFDENMKFYASDVDYHVRSYQAGIPLLKANVPFYHERSATLRSSSPEDRQVIENQANADRAYFMKKWGFAVGSHEHLRAVGFVPDEPMIPGLQNPSSR